MKPLAYACTDGAYDGKPAEVAAWTNCYLAWAYYGYWKGEKHADGTTDQEAWLKRMQICVDRVYRTTTMNIYLGLFGQLPENFTTEIITRVFTLMRPYWSRVIAIDIADEPKWSKQETKAALKKVRGILQAMKLPYKPLGITYTADQMSGSTDAFGIAHIKDGRLVGPDFVTLELYTDYRNVDQGFAKNLAYMKHNVEKAWTLLDPSTRCWYWLMGFNRNGAFKDEKGLAQLQYPSYQLVKEDARTAGFLIFNWARKNEASGSKGSKLMPRVVSEHKRISEDLGIL